MMIAGQRIYLVLFEQSGAVSANGNVFQATGTQEFIIVLAKQY
uniref:Uncharacterized protein n=1 Tax=Anguilla anguilla TaxID=7936 RepID=A0A0E9V8E7_ANGAN